MPENAAYRFAEMFRRDKTLQGHYIRKEGRIVRIFKRSRQPIEQGVKDKLLRMAIECATESKDIAIDHHQARLSSLSIAFRHKSEAPRRVKGRKIEVI